MSKVLWKHFVYPHGNNLGEKTVHIRCISPEKIIEKVRSFSYSNKQLLGEFSQATRSCSRACCLMHFACANISAEHLKLIRDDSFRVGIYCAVENGSVDYEIVEKVLEGKREEFHQNYKRERNPKMYLKQLPNLAAAQIGISYEINGPTYVFTHPQLGAIHALEQAEFDLAQSQIDFALVICAFSDEDPLNLLKHKQRQDLPLSESAVVLLLGTGSEKSETMTSQKRDYNYGMTNQLISRFNFKEE